MCIAFATVATLNKDTEEIGLDHATSVAVVGHLSTTADVLHVVFDAPYGLGVEVAALTIRLDG